MKKLLLLMTMSVMTAFSSFADTYSYTVSSGTNPFKTTNPATLNNVSWEVKSSVTDSPNLNTAEWTDKNTTWHGIQFGKSKEACVPCTVTASAEGNTVFGGKVITSITVNASCGASETGVFLSVLVNDTEYQTADNKTSVNLDNTAQEYEFSGSEIAGDVVISYTGTTTKAVYLRSINIVYKDAEASGETFTCKTPEFSDLEVYQGGVVRITSTPNSTIMYTIGDDIEEAPSPVELSFDEAGEYEVTAVASRDGWNDSEEVTYKIVVKEGREKTVEFDFVNEDYGMERGESTNLSKLKVFGNEWVHGTANNRTNLWSDGLRIYYTHEGNPDDDNDNDIAPGVVTLTTPVGTEITEVHMYHSCDVSAEDVSGDDTHDSGLEIDGNKMTFTATWDKVGNVNNHHLAKLVISYAAADNVHQAVEDNFKASTSEHFVVKVNGEEQTGSTISISQDKTHTVEFSHAVYPHAAIYTKFEPKTPVAQPAGYYYDAAEGFELHTAPYTLPGEGTLSYYAELNGHSTGVQSVTVSDPTTTSIKDVEMESNSVVYDLMGRKVQRPTHGIYIKGGVKVRL